MIDHLGRHVLESTAEGVPLLVHLLAVVVLLNLFFTCPAEVTDFEHILVIN